MARLSTRITARLLVPLALLVVVVLEEVITYEVRRHVADPYLRTAAVVTCYGVAFAIVGNRLVPHLQRLFAQGHRATRREGGAFGTFVFFGLLYAIVYFLFFVLETRGVRPLLPPALR